MSNRGPSQVAGGVQWGPDRYPVLWVWEPYGEERNGRYGEYHAFPLHRLVAFAEGELDHPRFEDDDVVVIEEREGFDPDDVDEEANEEERLNQQFRAWNEPDHREVHHLDYDIWNASPENLEALPPEDHGQETARAMADGGQP